MGEFTNNFEELRDFLVPPGGWAQIAGGGSDPNCRQNPERTFSEWRIEPGTVSNAAADHHIDTGLQQSAIRHHKVKITSVYDFAILAGIKMS